MKTTLLLPVILLAAGCHRSSATGYTPTPVAEVKPVSAQSVSDVQVLLPLEVGNQWVYAYRGESFQGEKSLGKAEGELTYRVARRRPDGTAMLALEQGGVLQDRQGMRSDASAVYQVSEALKGEGGFEDVAYSTPQPVVLLPLTPGRRFTWSGRGVMSNGKIGDGRLASKILAPESVDTGMGAISSFPVVTTLAYGKEKSENTTWFRPGVGMIRYRQEVSGPKGQRSVTTLTLKSYALKRS